MFVRKKTYDALQRDLARCEKNVTKLSSNYEAQSKELLQKDERISQLLDEGSGLMARISKVCDQRDALDASLATALAEIEAMTPRAAETEREHLKAIERQQLFSSQMLALLDELNQRPVKDDDEV